MQSPSQLCSDFRGKEKGLLHVQKRRLFIARKCPFCAVGQIDVATLNEEIVENSPSYTLYDEQELIQNENSIYNVCQYF